MVADGYRNHRIAKFNRDGKLEWQVNKLGKHLGEFNLPHGISSDDEENIYVADRNNARIQVFDHQGKPIANWNHKDIGRPFGKMIAQLLPFEIKQLVRKKLELRKIYLSMVNGQTKSNQSII
ncbi:hypothetical protein ABE65_011980 [Fictibacillus phosphorivorans]|uniref:6-bladed beta-propeller n=1 Tax=Fictibacillus phosphorivorans TaxID=1221500 RepID=A0A160IMA7_9BACL|nr:hypothetical protein ABE65_011980 [Fictibacillus phosphorivorans]